MMMMMMVMTWAGVLFDEEKCSSTDALNKRLRDNLIAISDAAVVTMAAEAE